MNRDLPTHDSGPAGSVREVFGSRPMEVVEARASLVLPGRDATAAGDVVRLHDVVIVPRGPRGVAERLRGIMLPRPEGGSPAG
ncbi:MAG TPA: hypothetical protein VF746_19430 [Longimicrobium sp.]|jgi:hypothetical protein